MLKKTICTVFLLLFFTINSAVAQNTYAVSKNDCLKQLLIDTQNQFNSAQEEISKLQEANYALKNELKKKQETIESTLYYLHGLESQNADKDKEIEHLNSLIRYK